MTGDARSRYEIVNELANKRIELIGQMGQLKSKDSTLKANVEKTKVQQTRQIERLKSQIDKALADNNKLAKSRKETLAKTRQRNDVEVANLVDRQNESISQEIAFIELLENDANTKANHAR